MYSFNRVNKYTSFINNILVNDILPLVVQDATNAVKDERKYDKINYLVQTRKLVYFHLFILTKTLIILKFMYIFQHHLHGLHLLSDCLKRAQLALLYLE